MKKPNFKPGELINMIHKGQGNKAMKIAGIKHSGEFHGKSNKLGQGGRAAQLKARGVPGGVIGNLARAAHAAPGQANFHKKAKSTKQDFGMAMKSAEHIHVHGHKGTIHIHVHKGSDSLSGTEEENKERDPMRMKHYKKAHKHYKKARKDYSSDGSKEGAVEPTDQEDSNEGGEEGKEKHAMKCKVCKGAHATSKHKHAKKHEKKAKKKSE